MQDNGWVLIVEQSERWTAALRSSLRRKLALDRHPRIRRLETPPQAADIDLFAPLVIGMELTPDNAWDRLALLDSLRRLPHVTAVALLDRPTRVAPDSSELAQAALEAGACLAIHSPREADRVSAIVDRAITLSCQSIERRLSLSEQAWRRLPWQAEPWPVG
jgi:hypothetical protein